MFVQQESYSIRIIEDASADLNTDILTSEFSNFSRIPTPRRSIERPAYNQSISYLP